MRTLADHIASPANAELRISVLDEPGQGGANHLYSITGLDISKNGAYAKCDGPEPGNYDGPEDSQWVVFQNGPIKEFGVNGVTQEALLAIVIDRLRSFQDGPYRCRENAVALTHCEEALMWLQKRTRDRMVRGVEGTNQK